MTEAEKTLSRLYGGMDVRDIGAKAGIKEDTLESAWRAEILDRIMSFVPIAKQFWKEKELLEPRDGGPFRYKDGMMWRFCNRNVRSGVAGYGLYCFVPIDKLMPLMDVPFTRLSNRVRSVVGGGIERDGIQIVYLTDNRKRAARMPHVAYLEKESGNYGAWLHVDKKRLELLADGKVDAWIKFKAKEKLKAIGGYNADGRGMEGEV